MGATSSVHVLDVAAVEQFAADVSAWMTTGELPLRWERALTHGDRGDRIGPRPDDRDRPRLEAEPRLLAQLQSELPLPQDDTLDHYPTEATQAAVELGLLTSAVGEGVAFGNARSLVLCAADALGVEEDVDTWACVEVPAVWRLDHGLFGWNHGSGGFAQGLRGMLGPRGCEVLLDELREMELPNGPLARLLEIGPDDPDQESRWVLAIVAHIAREAASRGYGLLHGRDLRIDHLGRWYRRRWMPDGRNADGKPSQSRRAPR